MSPIVEGKDRSMVRGGKEGEKKEKYKKAKIKGREKFCKLKKKPGELVVHLK